MLSLKATANILCFGGEVLATGYTLKTKNIETDMNTTYYLPDIVIVWCLG